LGVLKKQKEKRAPMPAFDSGWEAALEGCKDLHGTLSIDFRDTIAFCAANSTKAYGGFRLNESHRAFQAFLRKQTFPFEPKYLESQ